MFTFGYSGKKLWDYIKYRSENSDDIFYHTDDQILKQVQEMDLSDPESEHSYSDLINDYANSRSKNDSSVKYSTDNEHNTSSDGSYEKINLDDLVNSSKSFIDEPVPSNIDVPDLFVKSKINSESENSKAKSEGMSRRKIFSQRKFSEMSSFDDVEVSQNFVIPLQDIVKWAAQLLLALEKLHALGVICYDLQSDNLLITEDGDLILTYMCNVNELSDIFNRGNAIHIAPEIYSFEPITNAVDWWCFGAILYELLVGMPLSFIHPDGLSSYTNLKIPKFVSPEGRSLLKQLLTFEPQQRLGFGANGTENLKSHPFFHSVSWQNLLSKYSNY